MTEQPLAAECRAFAIHLTGRKPPEYVLRKYTEYHRRFDKPVDSFDRFLLKMARKNRPLAFIADAYCIRFRKRAELRRRLVLTLALLECTPPAADYLDSPGFSNRIALVSVLGLRGALSIASGLVSALFLEPVRLWHRLSEGGTEPE